MFDYSKLSILSLSIISSITGAIYNLLVRYTRGTPVMVTMFYVHFFAALFFASAMWYFSDKYDYKKHLTKSNMMKIGITLAFIAFITNTIGNYAMIYSKNPGYVKAIGSLSLVYITLGAVYLYGSHLTKDTFAGIILVILGVYLISRKMD